MQLLNLPKHSFSLAAASASLFLPVPVFAASATATGIDASFSTMLTDLTGMLGGNFGALVLLIALIIGIGVYAVTSNIRAVVASLIVAFLVGYGVDIIQGIGGVTASVDMLASLDVSLLDAPSSAHPTAQ